MRAQTANSALSGGRQRHSQPNSNVTGTVGLIRVEDRQSNTMNNTLNGFYSNPEPKPVQKDGTVVLQATLTMGNRQYLLNSLDSNSK